VTPPEYTSDLIVDRLADLGVEYVAMNPGASFRGVHDSLVNHADAPVMIETLHEKVAVGIAHGYGKVTGTPMAAFTHDLVGLLHATLGVYYAFVDRAPVLVLGGAGPMDQAKRRPWIDWIHTANSQNEAVRPYTKWDEHPYSVAAVPDALDRAHRIASMHPQGPVYLALDAGIQEEQVDGNGAEPPSLTTLPVPPAPDASALVEIATRMVAAERPVIVCGYVGRDERTWAPLVELAELLGAGVVDSGMRLSFPSRHPLNITGTDLIGESDAVLLLDIKDLGAHTGLLDKDSPGVPPRLAPGAFLFDVGFGDSEMSSWASHHGALYRPDIQALGDAAGAVPVLLDRVRRAIDAPDRALWTARMGSVVDATRRRWKDTASSVGDTIPTPWLVDRVGAAIRGHDWVLTAGTGGGWATRLWDMDVPRRHAGRSLGTATQIGISLGVALAHRHVEGRLVVDLQPDGDLLYDPGALWTAAHHRIPLLVVMVNNRLYGNDLGHQRHMADVRGRPSERASIGITIDEPSVDFAALARSMGVESFGPIVRPADLDAAIAGAIDVVVGQRRPALVDVVVEG